LERRKSLQLIQQRSRQSNLFNEESLAQNGAVRDDGDLRAVFPGLQGAAVRAIDDFFRELSPLLARPLLGFELENQPTPGELRAQAGSPGAASY
jgi:hypothetical protein